MKDNKLIAEFMELNIGKGVQADYTEHELKYDKSWDWLIPVINKIRSIDSTYEVEQVGKYDWDDEISHYEFDFDLTYESVVEYIQEYRLTPKEVN
jgi:hypothetical protein